MQVITTAIQFIQTAVNQQFTAQARLRLIPLPLQFRVVLAVVVFLECNQLQAAVAHIGELNALTASG